MLNFQPITPGIKTLADSYTFKYGEGSCQHSFVSSWTLRHKYGDEFCEHEGYLYTLRAKLCTENERIYLFPYGPHESDDAMRNVIQNVIDDAHSHNARAKFQTVTQSARDIITRLFPGRFTVNFNRDYSEYVYNIEHLFSLAGGKQEVKRRSLHKFQRRYEGRWESVMIAPEHIEMIRDYQNKWLAERIAGIDDSLHVQQLKSDNECIQRALDDFFMLGMFGIIMFIDGKISGYAYGFPLNDDVVEGDAEKADRNMLDVYTAVKHEFLRICRDKYTYFNFEEDLGDEGLRTVKTRDQPEYMIDKFIVTENEQA